MMDDIEHPTLDMIMDCLRRIRIVPLSEEYEIHAAIRCELERAQIRYKKEFKLSTKDRIDFFIEPGFGIEVKKGKPNRTQTFKQLQRYAGFDIVHTIILVVERSLTLPQEVNGKRCISFGMNRNWGIAL